jgi:hypothetical protein
MERVTGSRRTFAVWALATPVLVALVWGVCGGPRGSGGGPDAAPLAVPTTTPGRFLTGVPTPEDAPQTGSRLPRPAGTATGTSVHDALRQYAAAHATPRHRVVLSLRSPHKLPFVVYNIPTSRDHRSGKVTELGESWSVATYVYGSPDYAQLFTWAGPEGYPITCTITVDGRVTARHTTRGPWGKLYCQG